ncbi:uncharacterized protein LOC128540904 [Clarias gariepinus]|uniref:uncharacterized protein LOC128540904 n=1 Tax=Clarias gariepinus TaxID=13013 RepID=UPI00234DB42D|nr:uncharacterized protein LOC128540904 [Clarias gariepinus]
MAKGCLILCVLTEVLLITTAYGKVTVNCPSQIGTGGGPLHLTCTVACDGCSSTNAYLWKKANNFVSCKEKDRVITTGKSHTFNCTIEKTLMEVNGALTFWAQMTAGVVSTNFNVTIVPPVNPTRQFSLADPDKNKPPEEMHDLPPNSRTAAVALTVVSCFIIIIMVTFFLKRKINDNRTFSALCTHRMITETDTL